MGQVVNCTGDEVIHVCFELESTELGYVSVSSAMCFGVPLVLSAEL